MDVNADLGLFIQDTWTTKRLSLSPGFRWDHFNSSVPAQDAPAGRFVPARHFDAIENVPNWNNASPRLGAAYDLFGTGKTALKGNVGVYVQSQGPGFAADLQPDGLLDRPATWTDTNLDDIPQESELGRPSNLTFGVRRNQNPDPDIKRPYQWLWDIGVQHELMTGLAVTVSYNQRSFHDLIFTNNLALDPTDYTLVTIPDPRDASQTLPVYNINRAKFGQVNELDTNSGQNTRVFRGVDVTFNMRTPARRRDQRRNVHRPHDFPDLRGRGSQRAPVLRSDAVRHPAAHELQAVGDLSADLRRPAERVVPEHARERAFHHLPGDADAAADAEPDVGERAAERAGHGLQRSHQPVRLRDLEVVPGRRAPSSGRRSTSSTSSTPTR